MYPHHIENLHWCHPSFGFPRPPSDADVFFSACHWVILSSLLFPLYAFKFGSSFLSSFLWNERHLKKTSNENNIFAKRKSPLINWKCKTIAVLPYVRFCISLLKKKEANANQRTHHRKPFRRKKRPASSKIWTNEEKTHITLKMKK